MHHHLLLTHMLAKRQDNVHIQYWSIDGEYIIYLTRLRNDVKDDL